MPWYVDRLVLVSFLAHVVFGCCWHHAHSPSSSVSPRTVETCRLCDHHENQPESPPNDDQPRRQYCQGVLCMFLWAKSTSHAMLGVCLDCVSPARSLLAGMESNRIAATDSGPLYLRAPVGLHILNQTLLL